MSGMEERTRGLRRCSQQPWFRGTGCTFTPSNNMLYCKKLIEIEIESLARRGGRGSFQRVAKGYKWVECFVFSTYEGEYGRGAGIQVGMNTMNRFTVPRNSSFSSSSTLQEAIHTTSSILIFDPKRSQAPLSSTVAHTRCSRGGT